MGDRISFVNDIQILREMLIGRVQVRLQQQRQGRLSVELIDLQADTTVEIKGLPPDSIVIRSEDFENPLTVFNGSKGERRWADFVIVANDENERKWVICLETNGGNKAKREIVAQLKGAACFISYCKCIGKSFWESEEFLDGYEYRFVSIVRLNDPRKRRTEILYHTEKLHDRPEVYLKISRMFSIHFSKLIDPQS